MIHCLVSGDSGAVVWVRFKGWEVIDRRFWGVLKTLTSWGVHPPLYSTKTRLEEPHLGNGEYVSVGSQHIVSNFLAFPRSFSGGLHAFPSGHFPR